VGPAFHARYSALSKTYRYSISRSRVQDPFRHRYQYWFPRALEAGPVDRATGRLRGTHDFTSLSAGSDEVRDAVRDIYEAAWARGPEEWVFTVRGSGFLRSMVRRMVGTLIDVGLGRIGWEQMDAILEARDREAGGPTAPANGLTLARVYYGSGAGAPGGVTG
jgi:tRNA pseudouridine38-40 synthase